jgi:hypothetical protein
MTSDPVGGGIQISARSAAGLRPGELVQLTVIKRLSDTKWAVGIRGRVYPATSDLTLAPGATLRARVGSAGGRVLLTVTAAVPDAVRAALQGQGVPPGGLAEAIARALVQSGLPVQAEIVERARLLLAKSGLDERRGARIAASMVDRGIDPGSAGARALLPILGFGERGGEDPRRYRGRQLPDTPSRVKEFAASLAVKPADSRAALQAYNHLRGRSETWVVIPFVFEAPERPIAGTLKILFDPSHARPLALTLSADGIDFHLPLAPARGARRSRPRLSLFCAEPRLKQAAARGMGALRAKFHNMGFEVDDIIGEGDAFDGFSPIGEGVTLPSVDTVG